jgi:hypothetical protein
MRLGGEVGPNVDVESTGRLAASLSLLLLRMH